VWPPFHVQVPSSNVRSWLVMLPWESKKCVRAESRGFRVVADELDPADAALADAAVGGVDHEETPGHPLVDVTGMDVERRFAPRWGWSGRQSSICRSTSSRGRAQAHADAPSHRPGAAQARLRPPCSFSHLQGRSAGGPKRDAAIVSAALRIGIRICTGLAGHPSTEPAM
jgi:hypothetical protein